MITLPVLAAEDALPLPQKGVNPFDLILEKENQKPEGMTTWKNAEGQTERVGQHSEHNHKNGVPRHTLAITGGEEDSVMKQIQEVHEEYKEDMTESQKALAEKFSIEESDTVEIDQKAWEPTKGRIGSYSAKAPRQEKTNTTGLEMPKRLWSVD